MFGGGEGSQYRDTRYLLIDKTKHYQLCLVNNSLIPTLKHVEDTLRHARALTYLISIAICFPFFKSNFNGLTQRIQQIISVHKYIVMIQISL